MTALVTVHARGLSHIVTVSADAASQSGSTLGLTAGERISVRSLLYALLLQSSNDAAVALAEDISGSTQTFVARMNLRARQLGLAATRFASPHGLDDAGRSTAADLATLTRSALGSTVLRSVMATRYAVIANPAGPERRIQNRNAMLWLYPGTFAGKTGYTAAAGECLITAATRSGRTLVSVVLGDHGDSAFDDSATLLNYGFDAFSPSAVLRAGDPVGTVTVGGVRVDALAGTGLVRLLRSDRLDDRRVVVRVRAGLSLPIGAGQVIGRAVVSDHGWVVGTVLAVAAAAASAPPSPAIPFHSPGVPPPDPHPPVANAGPLGVLLSLLRSTFGSIL
jgi:D-alanyl-D-alanine carboxypeptidase (penicillin-binding protein 5/6)